MLWALAYHCDEDGTCHPSVGTLASEAGCGTERTARRRLRQLRNLHLIEIEERSVPYHANGRTLYLNKYRLTLSDDHKRPDTVLSGHEGKATGQNEFDDRTKLARRLDKTSTRPDAALSAKSQGSSIRTQESAPAPLRVAKTHAARAKPMPEPDPEPRLPVDPDSASIEKEQENLRPYAGDCRKVIGLTIGRPLNGKDEAFDEALAVLSADKILEVCGYVVAWRVTNPEHEKQTADMLERRLLEAMEKTSHGSHRVQTEHPALLPQAYRDARDMTGG